MKIKLKRLAIDVLEKDHRRIKELAAQQGIKMRELVIDAIALYIKEAIKEKTI